MFSTAITRKPPITFANGITTSNLGKPNFSLMTLQFEGYQNALLNLGLTVETLDPLPDFPDSHFVEDVAVVTPEIAVITRPGAEARRGEVAYIGQTLGRYRTLASITAPGTLDGGDVLQVENHFFIGVSDRTNSAGAEQLGTILAAHGYTWSAVRVDAGLHLKSSVNYLGKGTLLATVDFCARKEFTGYQIITVEPGDEYSANTLWVNGTLITPVGFPRTRQKLEREGFSVIEIEMSEARKMDGGLSCLSLRL